MFRFDDNSREARRWRMQQTIAKNAIEGIETDPELVALTNGTRKVSRMRSRSPVCWKWPGQR